MLTEIVGLGIEVLPTEGICPQSGQGMFLHQGHGSFPYQPTPFGRVGLELIQPDAAEDSSQENRQDEPSPALHETDKLSASCQPGKQACQRPQPGGTGMRGDEKCQKG